MCLLYVICRRELRTFPIRETARCQDTSRSGHETFLRTPTTAERRFPRLGTSYPFGVSMAHGRSAISVVSWPHHSLNCNVPMQTWFCSTNFDRYRLTPLTSSPSLYFAKTTRLVRSPVTSLSLQCKFGLRWLSINKKIRRAQIVISCIIN